MSHESPQKEDESEVKRQNAEEEKQRELDRLTIQNEKMAKIATMVYR